MYGNADDLRKEAGLLDQIDGSLVKTYAKRSGQDEAGIANWMAEETWFEATAAVELGFADQVADEAAPKDSAVSWNLSAYAHPPSAQQPPKDQPPLKPDVDREALHRAALKALIPA